MLNLRVVSRRHYVHYNCRWICGLRSISENCFRLPKSFSSHTPTRSNVGIMILNLGDIVKYSAYHCDMSNLQFPVDL